MKTTGSSASMNAETGWIVRRLVPFAGPLILATAAYFVTLGPVLKAAGGQQDLFTAVRQSVDVTRSRTFDVVFLGNSRVMRGVNPTFIDAASHNFAFDDDTFLYYRPKAAFLARTGHALRQAFVGVDLFQLCYWNYDRYLSYRELLEDPELDRWLFDRRYGPDLAASVVEKKVALRFFYRSAVVDLAKRRVLGGAPASTNQIGESYSLEPNGYYRVTYARPRALDPLAIPRGPTDDRGVALLEETVAELRTRGVDVVLFTPPASTQFRSIRAAHERAQFATMMESIAARHGARYVSWEEDPAFSDDDYPDGTHLSVDGATRFSRMLSAWMKQSGPSTSSSRRGADAPDE
jgi:hypothetical protein